MWRIVTTRLAWSGRNSSLLAAEVHPTMYPATSPSIQL